MKNFSEDRKYLINIFIICVIFFIISILLGLVFKATNFQDLFVTKESVEKVEAQQLADDLKNTLEDYYFTNFTYPNSLSDLNFDKTKLTENIFYNKINEDRYELSIKLKNGDNISINN